MWQLVNCLFTASYSLYLRGTMDRVVTLTANRTKLDEFSMVFYNNLLSLPLIGVLMWWCAPRRRRPAAAADRRACVVVRARPSFRGTGFYPFTAKTHVWFLLRLPAPCRCRSLARSRGGARPASARPP
jgi:hypothetical protein